LIKCGKINLPDKKELLTADNGTKVVLVDVTESPVEHPQKSSVTGTWEKRNATQLKR
jgi:hypothetical protein